MPHADDSGPAPPPLDEEERAFREGFAQLVDWYRVKQTRSLVRAFAPAFALFVPLGGLLVALSSSGRVFAAELSPALTALGILIVALGPLWALVQLVRAIGQDTYVAVRVDGLVLRLDPQKDERLLAWEEIEDFEYDTTDDLANVLCRDGSAITLRARFADIEARALVKRLKDARRLAVWNRLEPRNRLP